MSQRDQERLANVYKDLSENPGATVRHIEDRIGKSNAVKWAIDELLEKGLIVKIPHKRGESVDQKYATLRGARNL